MTAESTSEAPEVTQFYDVADVILTTIWGNNYHSGYWMSDVDDSANDVALRRMNEVLIEKLGVTSGQRVLDVGSGLGEPAFQLATVTGAEVLGVAISQQHVDESNRIAAELGLERTVSFENADGHALPYSDDSFDAVWVIESFIHMDRPGALREIARVLRPGGRLLFTDLVQPDQVATDTGEERSEMLDTMAMTDLLTFDAYRKLVVDSGMEILEMVDIAEHTRKTHERMAAAARSHYDHLVAEHGSEAAEVLDMMMMSIDVGYVLVVARVPETTS